MMRNAVGELDVDIILDEGPDSITLMQDTYDAISQALPAVAPMLSPARPSAVMDVLIETSPLPADIKKKFRDAGENEAQQPDPKQQEAQAKLLLQQQEGAGAHCDASRQKAQARRRQQAAGGGDRSADRAREGRRTKFRSSATRRRTPCSSNYSRPTSRPSFSRTKPRCSL